MANALDLIQAIPPVRLLLLGYPGSGKTGALVSLLNVGFKMRVLDFDGNLEPVFTFAQRDKLANLDILQLKGADAVKMGSHVIEANGVPHAFADAVRAMDRWTYKRGEETIDLGSSKDWGPDTIVVLDSLTSMGEAALIRAAKLANRTFGDLTDRVYGTAMGEQERFIKMLSSTRNRFHLIVISHLKMIGPRDIRKGDSEIQQDIKKAVADLITTRLYPSALGWALPQTIAKEFPTVLLAERKVRGNSVSRLLRTFAGEELDLKFPAPNLPADLPAETGLVKVFELLSPGSLELVRKGVVATQEETSI